MDVKFFIFTRYIIILLMLIIIGSQVYPMIPKPPSPECLAALAQVELISTVLDDVTRDYDQVVYKLTDNINQQQFRVAEYQYFALTAIIKQQAALLDVTTYCR